MKSAPSPDFEIDPRAAEDFKLFVAAEYAYFSPTGSPLCWPVTPYWYRDRGVLAIATGLAYPNKANYAAKNPKVAMLFSDPKGSGISAAPQVCVKGVATVLDEDVQANTDRYVNELRNKFPVARIGLNPVSVKFLDFYLPRIWVEITPASIDVTSPFGEPDSRSLRVRPASNLLRGHDELRRLVERLGVGVVVTKGNDGFPSMERVSLRWSGSRGGRGQGKNVALSIHHHSLGGTRFRAYMVRGKLAHDESTLFAERLVGFFGNGLVFPFSAILEISRLRKRLRKELDERGWQMPTLRLP